MQSWLAIAIKRKTVAYPVPQIGLGMRRSFRSMGLLLAGMRRLKAVGMDTTKLGVDAENRLGAGRLYESVGFRKIYTQISYVKDV